MRLSWSTPKGENRRPGLIKTPAQDSLLLLLLLCGFLDFLHCLLYGLLYSLLLTSHFLHLLLSDTEPQSTHGLRAGPASKEESRGSTEPRLALTNEKRKRSCYYFFFLAAGFFLAAVFFAAFFLAAIIHNLLREFCRPDGFHFCNPSRFAAEPQRRGLRDLGGFTKWVAHSRLCGDNQVSQRHTSCLDTAMSRVRQGVDKIFFREVSGEMLRVRDIHHAHGPLEGPSAHRMRALRNCLVRAVHKSHRGQDFARVVGSTTRRTAQLSDLMNQHA